MDAADAARRPPAPADTGVFSSDPYIGRDLAKIDWARTSLGPPAQWPQSLRTAISILLSSRFAMWMAWGPDLTFFCNDAYRRVTLGTKYPWALGRPASDVWAEIWDDIGPRVDGVLSTGQATWDEALMLILERSGYAEESYHTFSYSPLRDEAGSAVGLLCVVSEETDRVIAQRRMLTLRELGSDPTVTRSEDQVLDYVARQLGRNLRDLPFTLTYLFDDAGGAVLAASSGIAAGHPLAQELLTVENSAGWPIEVAARGESVLVELSGGWAADLPTGLWSDPPVQALVVPLLQQGGAPVGFTVAALNRYRPLDEGYRGFIELIASHIAAEVASARSFRGQQERAEGLAELDRAKTAFFSNISHEFRTPLTLILGPLTDIQGRGDDVGEQIREDLDVAHRNALRLAKLVNTLLDFSRLEAGRMQAQFAPTDVAASTVELASVFRSAVDRAGLDLVVDCPPLTELVYLDRDMWEKVILNLLSNAVKFTFEGSITVRLQQDESAATVTISDTGIGVAAAEVPRLFERFHRVESARARSNEGSGIGLALVKELVGLHGGTITADSVEGVGTTFTIRLPFGTAHLPADSIAVAPATADSAAVAPAAADSSVVAPAAADPYVQEALRWLPTGARPESSDQTTAFVSTAAALAAATPARVLVADDNADMREYLSRLLRTAGYHVEAVEDGQLALERVRAEVPDLVVSDVMMPRLDGLALVARLRNDARTAAVPVLLLSARAGQEASIEGLQAGADDYLVKPFAAADLLARVRANVELSRLRNHHARWRTALVDSLQEAFFVGDDSGAFIEINSAFTQVLGYGSDGLPYEGIHPWWPDPDTDAEAYHQVATAFAELAETEHGTFTIPVNHRDGHRLWVTVNYNHATDPDTGRLVTVGTFRDVTAELYFMQRQTALAALNQVLAQADTVDQALQSTAEEMLRLWQARRVLAATFLAPPGAVSSVADVPNLLCVGDPVRWAALPEHTREVIGALRDGDLLATDTTELGSAGIAIQHPRGVLVLWIELAEQRPFTAADQTLLTVLAGRLGQGLQRVHQLDQQRETALALQDAILGPVDLPSGFAVRYQPASHPLQVGGDWYDVVDLDDGRIALIVGDCVGHGLAAAAVMGQLRSACRALLLEHPSPRLALAALDRFAARLPGAECTTAFCGVLNTKTGELVYSSAGHPPPILVYGDRTSRTVEDGRAIPLGVRPERPRPEARLTIPPRATLLLYTDGLVERRRQSLDLGIARAIDLVQDGRGSALDDLASEIMSRLAPAGGYQDDVALLLYRQPAPLQLNFPADVEHIATSRSALRGWLNRAGITQDQSLDVLIAAGEAVANAIEHGHRDRIDGTITLRASTLADQLYLSVVDTGDWKVPQPGADISRGRGVTLMRALMQDVSIQPEAAGTTVRMHTRIS